MFLSLFVCLFDAEIFLFDINNEKKVILIFLLFKYNLCKNQRREIALMKHKYVYGKFF
jgi:hypothetical protein